jgi:6-phosphogluconolactonase
VKLVVQATYTEAARSAAEEIARLLREAINTRGMASLALSGGKTPREMVEHLSATDVQWQNVQLFQVDERAVPLDDPARNWSTFGPLVDRLPSTNCHPMPVERADADTEYSSVLSHVLGSPAHLDVVHLGLGVDGHTASLVPGDPVVAERDREVSWVAAYQGHRRLTLTQPVLTGAGRQVWLVRGKSKAGALRELVEGRSDAPAGHVIAFDTSVVFADAAASS